MAIKKYLGFVKCFLIELLSELSEAVGDREKYRAVEQLDTHSIWND
jgi:hypothetical protein